MISCAVALSLSRPLLAMTRMRVVRGVRGSSSTSISRSLAVALMTRSPTSLVERETTLTPMSRMATMLLAREVVAWSDTLTVLTPENLTKARHAVEVWEEHAGICERHDEVKEREPA